MKRLDGATAKSIHQDFDQRFMEWFTSKWINRNGRNSLSQLEYLKNESCVKIWCVMVRKQSGGQSLEHFLFHDFYHERRLMEDN